MRLKEGNLTIELTVEECYNLACDLFRTVRHSIETHWINYPNSYLENGKHRLKQIKQFFEFSGYGEHGKYQIEDLQKLLNKLVTEKENKEI